MDGADGTATGPVTGAASTTPGASMTSTRDGLRDAVPIVIGYVTLGLAAGMLLVAEGLSWWWAPVWSVVIYSGTMQMLLVPLAGAGEPLAAIAASAAFVSGRHVFYGLGFPLDRIRGKALTRLYAVHAITDEVYALLASKDRTRMSSTYLLTVEATSQASWPSGRRRAPSPGRGWRASSGTGSACSASSSRPCSSSSPSRTGAATPTSPSSPSGSSPAPSDWRWAAPPRC